MEEENVLKKYSVLGLVIALVAVVVIYYFYSGEEPPKPPQERAVESLQDVSSAVPEITTNPVEEKTPELNPIERANPFKYTNPLR